MTDRLEGCNKHLYVKTTVASRLSVSAPAGPVLPGGPFCSRCAALNSPNIRTSTRVSSRHRLTGNTTKLMAFLVISWELKHFCLYFSKKYVLFSKGAHFCYCYRSTQRQPKTDVTSLNRAEPKEALPTAARSSDSSLSHHSVAGCSCS